MKKLYTYSHITQMILLYVLCCSLSSCNKQTRELGHFGDHDVYQHDGASYNRVVYEPFDTLGFSHQPARGIDSYVGRIKNDSISFSFDFGWYNNDGVPSERELKYAVINKMHRPNRKDECGLSHISKQKLLEDMQIVQVKADTLFSAIVIDVMYHDTYCILDLSLIHI